MRRGPPNHASPRLPFLQAQAEARPNRQLARKSHARPSRAGLLRLPVHGFGRPSRWLNRDLGGDLISPARRPHSLGHRHQEQLPASSGLRVRKPTVPRLARTTSKGQDTHPGEQAVLQPSLTMGGANVGRLTDGAAPHRGLCPSREVRLLCPTICRGRTALAFRRTPRFLLTLVHRRKRSQATRHMIYSCVAPRRTSGSSRYQSRNAEQAIAVKVRARYGRFMTDTPATVLVA
jgi:hypothetical protein